MSAEFTQRVVKVIVFNVFNINSFNTILIFKFEQVPFITNWSVQNCWVSDKQ